MSLLNLGGLINVGNGQDPQNNGLVNVAIPGLIDVSLLPGGGNSNGGLGGVVDGVVDTVGGIVGGVTGGNGVVDGVVGGVTGTVDGLLGNATGVVGSLLDGDSGLGTLLSGLGNGADSLLSGLGTATAHIGKGLGDLLGGIGGGANGPGVVIIDIDGGTKIVGTSGNDYLVGSDANDYLYGGGGDDILDGRGGYDIGIYQGNRADYTIAVNSGVTTIADGALLRDGTDTLRSIEFLQFKDGGLDLATNTFVPQSLLNSTFTGYRAVVREDAPAGLAETVGVGIAQNKFTFDQYVAALIDDVGTSTIPALLVTGLIEGFVPGSDRLDTLTGFAQQHHDYYTNVLKSDFAHLGPYEALGRGFSSTTEFQVKYAGGTDSDFVAKAYVDVFGQGPSGAAQAALLEQVAYFEGIYQAAGLSAARADIEARGAVYGQIVGHAAHDASEPLLSKAEVLLTGFANGDTSQYGATFAL